LLAQGFLQEFAGQNNKAASGFTSDALASLMQYAWPGNVRELRTAIEHAVVFSRTGKVAARDLPPWVRAGAKNAPAETSGRGGLARNDLTIKEAEKELIIQALKDTKGNRTLAAKKLGMSRRSFHRKLHVHHLEDL
jgi:DNA-binding NtrC family response regulator